MDVNWCLTGCGRYADVGPSSPFCSDLCRQKDELANDSSAVFVQEAPYPDDDDSVEGEPFHPKFVASVTLRGGQWPGKSYENIRAWAESIPEDAYQADVTDRRAIASSSRRSSTSTHSSTPASLTSTSTSSLSSSQRLRRPVFNVSLPRTVPPKLCIPAPRFQHQPSTSRPIRRTTAPTSESSLTSILTDSIATPTSDKAFALASNIASWVAPRTVATAAPHTHNTQNPLRPSPDRDSPSDVSFDLDNPGESIKFEGDDAPYLMMRSRTRRPSGHSGSGEEQLQARSSVRMSRTELAGKDRPAQPLSFAHHGLPHDANHHAYRTRGRRPTRAIA